MKPNWRIVVVIVVLGGALPSVWKAVKSAHSPHQSTIIFSEFVRDVEAGKVKRVSISEGAHVTGEYKDNASSLYTLIPKNYAEVYKILHDKGVEVEIRETEGPNLASALINSSPFLLLLAFWIYMMSRLRNQGPPRSY